MRDRDFSQRPADNDSSPVWQGYVIAAPDREQRRERLAQCPEAIRDKVRRHVETAFAIRKEHDRTAR